MPKFLQIWIANDCEGDPDEYMTPQERRQWNGERPNRETQQELDTWVKEQEDLYDLWVLQKTENL